MDGAFFVIMTVGYTISFLSLIYLGKSFGISPAKRAVVSDGPYKLLKHPMYIGYAISESAFLMIYFSVQNVVIYIMSLGLYFFRAKRENEILRG